MGWPLDRHRARLWSDFRSEGTETERIGVGGPVRRVLPSRGHAMLNGSLAVAPSPPAYAMRAPNPRRMWG